jgi:hypothetical protein
MKKLLALLLVLAMASMANAAISFSTSPMGQDVASYVPAVSSEITLMTSDTIWLGVNWDGQPGGFDGFLNIEAGPAEFTGGLVNFYDNMIGYAFPYGAGFGVYNSTPSGTVGPAEGPQFGVEFHCMGLGDVDVVLRDLAGGVAQAITIHQIPEPLTLSLLGLGGLGLLRRRR